MNESNVELRHIYTRESFIAASKDFAKAFPEPSYEKLRRGILQTIFMVCGVLPIIYYTWLYLIGLPIRITDPWIILIYGVILTIAIWDVVRWLLNRFRPPAEAYDKDDRWKGERHWIISDAGIQLETPVSQSNIKWANFNEVVETSSTYLFIYGIKENPQWLFCPNMLLIRHSKRNYSRQ
jgi:hypothetical protein